MPSHKSSRHGRLDPNNIFADLDEVPDSWKEPNFKTKPPGLIVDWHRTSKAWWKECNNYQHQRRLWRFFVEKQRPFIDREYWDKQAEWRKKVHGDPRRRRPPVPKGWTRKQAQEVWDRAEVIGKRVIEDMAKKNMINKDAAGIDSLEFFATMMANDSLSWKDRLSAAAKLAEFTLSKPESKSTLNVNKGEELLAAVQAEIDKESKDS